LGACLQLREVYVGSSNGFCDHSLISLATNCTFLHTLVILALAHCNKKLQRLELFQSRSLSDDAVAQVVTGCGDLLHLDLAENPNLGAKTAAAIASSCPKLKNLDLSSTDVEDKGVVNVLHNCTALVSLGLMACFRVSDACVDAIRTCCASLEALELTGCALVTTAALLGLMKQKRFKVLLLGGLALENEPGPRVTDEVVFEIVRTSGYELRMLGLNNIPALTNAAVETIADGCPDLPWLDIDGCDVDIEGLQLGSACETANEVDPSWDFSDLAIFVRSYMPRWLGGGQMLLPQVLDLPWHAERRIMRDAQATLSSSGVDPASSANIVSGTSLMYLQAGAVEALGADIAAQE
jgi:hypothetical protein